MSEEQKSDHPADKAADGAFIAWVASHPTATLASKEEARLLAEIDRLRARCREIDDEAYDYAEQIEQLKAEIDRLRAAAKDSADHYADARAEIDRLRAREIVMAQHEDTGRTWNGPRCAIPSRYFEVNTAEQEVGRDL